MKGRLKIKLNKGDRELLELISSTFSVSLSAATRMAIRATAQKLGLVKGDLDHLVKK